MHFLAHLQLANGNPHQQIGQIAGDFAKGLVLDELHPEIAMGVRLHRRVDSFTDSHPSMLASKTLMTGPYRRYSGLVLDLYYDHLLAKHWTQMTGGDLRTDADAMVALLKSHRRQWTSGMVWFTRHLIRSDMLFRLQDVSVMEPGLKRITSRLKRPVDLRPAIDQVVDKEDEHLELFLTFYPELMQEIAAYKVTL